MAGHRHRPRGTTLISHPLDIASPTSVLGAAGRRHLWGRWWRPLLIAGATAAALAVLIASRPW